MLFPTHLLAGLIIGKITGDYPTSLIGSVIIDSDHLVAYYRNGILFKFKKFIAATFNRIDQITDARNYFHNAILFMAVAIVAMFINFKIGLVFSLAYFVHLIFDSLDNVNYLPFYPSQKLNFNGPIKYCSLQEFIFSLILFIIFFLV
jgi:hypothetical protein